MTRVNDALAERHDLFENFPLALAQRLQLSVAVVQNPDGGREAQLQRPVRHGERVLGIADAAAEHGIDVHVKLGVLGQQRQFLVEHLEALLRNVVRLHVVDADLQVLEPGAIQPLDAIGHQQVAVGDHARRSCRSCGCAR